MNVHLKIQRLSGVPGVLDGVPGVHKKHDYAPMYVCMYVKNTIIRKTYG